MNEFDLIEAYFEQNLSAAQRKELENRLSKEPALLQQFNAYRLAMGGVTFAQNKNIIATVQRQYLEQNSQKSRWPRLGTIWALAASVLLVVGMYATWQVYELDAHSLLAKQSKHYDVPVFRGSALLEKSIIENYKKANYNEVLSAYAKETQPSSDEKFYYAMALFNLQKYDLAKKELESLQNMQNTEHQYDIAHYLMLTAVNTGNYDQALAIVNNEKDKVLNPYSSFYTEAFVMKLKLLKFKESILK